MSQENTMMGEKSLGKGFNQNSYGSVKRMESLDMIKQTMQEWRCHPHNSPFFNRYPLIHLFLGKTVLVELEDCVFHGKLLRYELGRKMKPHKPTILIVESQAGPVIIRGNWTSIGECKF
jgi:hypothetical protein